VDLEIGIASAVVGFAVGVPASAIVVAVPPEGRLSMSRRWWAADRVPPSWRVAVAVFVCGATGLVGLRLGWSLALPACLLTAVSGVLLALIDIRRRRVPYVVALPTYGACMTTLAVAAVIHGSGASLVRAVLATAALSGGFLGLALAMPGQLGLGDVVLVGVLGATLGWLGWEAVWAGLVAGLLLQAATVLVLLMLRRTRMGLAVPFGPALVGGWLVAVALLGG
jgi:leader peptidase (prepilin peptidase)/N-methyltransferase